MDVQGVNFKVLSPLKYRCCAKNKDEHFVCVCVQVYVPVHMQRLEENISVALALSSPPLPYFFKTVSLTELGTRLATSKFQLLPHKALVLQVYIHGLT